MPVVVKALVLCSLLLAAPAFAQSTGQETEAERRQRFARTVFEDANRYLENGNYEAALERYRIAYELSPRPKILLNIATLLLELGHEVEAANAFARYADSAANESERVNKVRQILHELDGKLGRLDLRIDPPADRVRVNGRVVGKGTSCSILFRTVLRVAPGRHTVEVERSEARSQRREVDVAAGSVEIVRVGVTSRVHIVHRDSTEREPSPRAVAFIRVDLDPVHLGAVSAPGLALRLVDSWYVYGNALVGDRQGAEIGIRWEPSQGALKLRGSASIPLFFADGARFGGRVAIGAGWGKRIRAVGELAIAYHPSVPEDIETLALLAALGVELGF